MPELTERFIGDRGRQTWCGTYGDVEVAAPLLVLHGGPGLPHDYLQDLSQSAEEGHPVVFYDQLGCGKSDQPDDPELWSMDLFVDEVDAVRNALSLDSVNLLGHSWGGSLALEYMLTEPDGVEKLVLYSPLLDSKLCAEEIERLKNLLPPEASEQEFQDNFFCRVQPTPEPLLQTFAGLGMQVHDVMWGPGDTATGKLKDWTALDRLDEIETPVLLLSGRHDQMTPRQMALADAALRNSSWVIFENSSHMAHLEEPEAYLSTMADFLSSE